MIDFLHLAKDLGDTVAALKDVAVVLAAAVTACAAAVAAYCAWRGLSEWRKKLRGEVWFDVARRLLEATLRIEGAFQTIRIPFRFPHERSASGIIKSDSAILSERWERVPPKWQDWVARCVEAEALWHDDTVEVTKSMRKIGLDMSIAFRQYADMGENAGQATKDIVFGNLKRDEDKFDAELEAATELIKLFCAAKMKL